VNRDSVALWIITQDHIDTGCANRKSMAVTDENQSRCTIPIRLYDDDGVLYYSGVAAPEHLLEGDEELAFEPLMWAAAHAGCTRLDYLDPVTCTWRTL
jgi:hypothetical protein